MIQTIGHFLQQCCPIKKPKECAQHNKTLKEKLTCIQLSSADNHTQTIMVDGQLLTREQCRQKFGMQNFENEMVVDINFITQLNPTFKENVLNFKQQEIMKIEIEKYFMKNESLIGIRKASETQLGYEAYATMDIKRGELVGVYLGKLTPTGIMDPKTNEHIMLVNPQSLYTFDVGNHYVIDATKHGNETRFIQHLPNEDSIPKDVRHKIAIANLKTYAIVKDHLPYVCFYATSDIKKGDLLGYNYGDKAYWEALGIKPILFKAGTNVRIDERLNQRMENYQNELKRINNQNLQNKKYV